MPGRAEIPAPAIGFKQVHQVVVEVIFDALPFGSGMQAADINDIITHQQIGACSGRTSTDAKGRDTWTKHIRGPLHGEGLRRPGLRWQQLRKNHLHQGIFANRFAQESAPFHGQLLGGANQLQTQARIPPQFPDQPPAQLHALAMVARQLHYGPRAAAQEVLQFAMNLGLTQRLTG